MLILRRNKGQAICLSPEIEITILNVQYNQVKLGIVAPDDIRVVRKEVFDKQGAPNCHEVSMSFLPVPAAEELQANV